MAVPTKKVEMGATPAVWVVIDDASGARSISMQYSGVEAFYSVAARSGGSGTIAAESIFPPNGFRVDADLAADEVMWGRGRGHVVVDGG